MPSARISIQPGGPARRGGPGVLIETISLIGTRRYRCCSHCGFTHPDNRDGEEFECLKCGYKNHADYNAAKNVGLRYLPCHQTGDGGGEPVGVHLNRGTLNANGGMNSCWGFRPERESTRKPNPQRSERRSRGQVGRGSLLETVCQSELRCSLPVFCNASRRLEQKAADSSSKWSDLA
jgi:hypothetical protein